MDCIFCKITSGVIPTNFVAESEHAVAFRDNSPRQPVHLLVVPKKHYSDVAELTDNDENLLLEVLKLARQVAAENTDGSFRLTFNTGASAGQTVFHVHAHVTAKAARA